MRSLLAWRRRGKKPGQSGQSLVELSLILPIFLLLFSGLVEIGDALNSYLTVIDASRDAARLGSRGLATDTEIRDLVDRDMGGLRDPFAPASDGTVTHNPVSGD